MNSKIMLFHLIFNLYLKGGFYNETSYFSLFYNHTHFRKDGNQKKKKI